MSEIDRFLCVCVSFLAAPITPSPGNFPKHPFFLEPQLWRKHNLQGQGCLPGLLVTSELEGVTTHAHGSIQSFT